MKKNYILLLLSIIILLVVISCFYNDNKIIYMDKFNKLNFNDNNISFMYETDTNTGIYEPSTSSNWPVDGYLFNNQLSKCENGSTLIYDEETKKMFVKGNVSDKCYIYFDAVLKPSIESLTISNLTQSSVTITASIIKGTFDVYKYLYSINNGITWNESSTNSFTIFGLSKGTSYEIKVYALDVKGNKSNIELINVATPNTISFTLEGAGYPKTTYYAESGMNWNDWVNSTYSNNKYVVGGCHDSSFIGLKINSGSPIYIAKSKNGFYTEVCVKNSDIIIDNYNYVLMKVGEMC